MLCSFAGADFCSGKTKHEESTVVLSSALTQHGLKSARQNRYAFDSRQLMQKKTAEAVFFIHIILASGAEVCGLDLLVCEKLFAGAGHGKAAGFKDIANVSGFQRHICVLLD